ncbi:dienelactone hydrolase [Amycolatopsis bartoniae]|uniref:Esterase n=1 Tax=Amycolatopsis bartoniae TaxID=941986 RepID=A0A8H9IW50_9PSEU|nr:Tat pathway signal protein [Amycolatopsis bartoniae]MBB2937769.1 dienelactone hydrolase [Amycolatopsis bartoniae]TVT08153.1 Tat pathway signal protein [Amycolatopsis bartoniae]GHF40582.1 esterase [Amycolatopsis bartoniae]
MRWKILTAAVLVTAALTVPAAAATRLALPEPSGPYRVGETDLHLVDAARPDPWVAGPRELMVSVHYPALLVPGRAAPYMLPGAAAHFDAVTANQYLGLGTPPGTDWAAVRTHAVRDAPALPGRRPVIVYSPGLGEPRTWGTAAAEDLASRGYVVVSADHTYEAPEVQFPDGSVRTMVEPGDPDPFLRKALDVRVRDTRFVLDSLARLPWLTVDRVGMLGHSMGGAAAALTMAADPRVVAGVDLDGNLTYYDGSPMPPAAEGLAKPFLLVGKDGTTDTGPGWTAFLAHTPGWARQLKLLGSEHASFTDAEALLPQLGVGVGTLDPATAIRTQRAYLAAFFDRWLRGGDGRLLDGPSSRYPAMAFVS